MTSDSDDRSVHSGVELSERGRALARRVEELITDIGSVLHANTSILFMAQQSIDVALRALAPNPFTTEGTPSFSEVDRVLDKPAKNAARALDRLLDDAAQREDGPVFSADVEESLRDASSLLADHVAFIPIEESRASTLRTVACNVQDALDAVPARALNRERLRNARKSARDIERIAALASLMQTRSAIIQMDYTIRSFREFVTADMRPVERSQPLPLAGLIESAHTQLVEYARTSDVEIKLRNEAPDGRIQGVERELVRAIANLLHNAIKYSWRRDAEHKPWVRVTIRRAGRELVTEIENWGVPISRTELSEDMVFELGYRGKWSTDRGRLGTGIGLTDAREVIGKHRGVVELDSRPARSWGPEDPEDPRYYRQPFITRVTFRLPEAL